MRERGGSVWPGGQASRPACLLHRCWACVCTSGALCTAGRPSGDVVRTLRHCQKWSLNLTLQHAADCVAPMSSGWLMATSPLRGHPLSVVWPHRRLLGAPASFHSRGSRMCCMEDKRGLNPAEGPWHRQGSAHLGWGRVIDV